ncbi:MAG: DUF2339 domain-containing protein [Elusimicrobiota bacterium]
MAEPNEVKELREAVEALNREVRSLHAEVSELKKAKGAAPDSARPAKDPLGLRSRKPAPPAPPAPASEPAAFVKTAGISTEQFIGERVLHYVGMLVLAVGIGFFLVWRAAHTGPTEKVLMAAAAGAALVLLGEWWRSRPPYDKLTSGVTGGGWTVLYLSAYAAYHFPATKVLSDPSAELMLLLGVAGGMILHALWRDSKALRLFSFGLTYIVLFICGAEVASPFVFLVLLGASALIAVETGHADILIVSAVGFYLNYLPEYRLVVSSPEETRSLAAFLPHAAPLAGGYLLLALLPLLPRAKARLIGTGEERPLDAACCFNAVVFAGLAASMGAAYFKTLTLSRAFGLSLFFVVPGLAYAFALPRRLAFASTAPVLGLLILAGGVFSMVSPMLKMFAWLGVSTLWVWIGLLLDHKAWRVSGLLTALLTFGFYIHVVRGSPADRLSASTALYLFAALSYLASRYYRLWLKGEVSAWEEPAKELWLYVGSAALVLALWGSLDPAPLAVALIALAIAGEFAAVFFGRIHLWAQASALSLGAGLYSLFIDYGPDVLEAAAVSPRLLTCACVVAGMAYLHYADPTPPEFTRPWKHWAQAGHRRWLSWAMAAVASLAVYQEFDPRLRLPLWAAGAALLYYLGSLRDEPHLKAQAVILCMTTAVEGVFSYLLYPKPLLSAPSHTDAALYWGSSLLLLLNLWWSKDSRRRLTSLDAQASWVFCLLSLTMIALYLVKELDSYRLTMALSLEGILALVLGIVLGYLELRLPALLLLGGCVVKAVLFDTSHLPLPERVASFVVLGIILLAASMMYVRIGRHGQKDPGAGPD